MVRTQAESLEYRLRAGGDDWEALVLAEVLNKRIKLKEYQFDGSSGLMALCQYLITLARDEGFGKVLTEVREADRDLFLSQGFVPEGTIPGYFRGETAHILSYFTDPDRQASTRLARENEILEAVLQSDRQEPSALDERFSLGPAGLRDIDELAQIFRRVFETYPAPLHETAYIREQMETEASIFHLVRDGEKLVSTATAEVNWARGHAEMTNCATLPGYRGAGLMAALLQSLEREMQRRNVNCLFSLARASSYGMNLVLWRLGYRFGGRLINNSHICGAYEDMNVWVRE